MARWRGGVAVLGAVVACASCASILGIEEPKPYHPGDSGGASVSNSASATGGGQGATGGGQGGAPSTASSSGSGAVTGAGGNGGGGVDCGVLDHCPNASPPCVDTSSDRKNCGMCDHACDATRACVLGQCATPHVKTPDYRGQLSSMQGDYIASSLSVTENGPNLAVGGVLAGTNPFGDGINVNALDPFVWLTDISGAHPVDGKLEAHCHVMGIGDCPGLMTNEAVADVAISDQQQQHIQLLGSLGLFSTDPTLVTWQPSPTLMGTGLGLSATAGAQLALTTDAQVTVFPLMSGVPNVAMPDWSLSLVPASTIPIRVTRAGDLVIVAGGAVGPGGVQLGDGMGTVVGARDAFVAVYHSDQSLLWFRTFPSAVGASAAVTAVSNNGSSVFVVGQYQTSIDIESGAGQGQSCGVLQATPGQTQNFAARFSLSPTGDCFWARSFGSADGTQDTPTGIVDFGGNVAIVGSTTATATNFGGQDLAVPSPLFFLELNDGDGSYEYSWAFGHDPTNQATGQPVGVGTTGTDLWIAGYYTHGAIADLMLTPADVSQHTSYVVHFPNAQF